MADAEQVLQQLRALARPENVAGMAQYGMSTTGRLGIAVPELRRIAKGVGREHALALALWQTSIPEARIVAALVADPRQVTEEQMESWVRDLDSWDVCDQVCANLWDKSPLAWKKVRDWAVRDEEFVRRAAFALLACLAWHDKHAPDAAFIEALSLIRQAASDERNMVKKAVNWALRHIGKRNRALNAAAIAEAQQIARLDSRAARWVSSDALRELQSDAVQRRLGGSAVE